jgi:acyl-CoA thioesterase-1
VLGVLLLVLSGPSPALPADEVPLRLLLLGDSLVAGYGLPRADAFPAQLSAALKAGGVPVTIIEGGVSGDTTAGGLARLPWVLGSAPSEQPDAVLVELGGNDVLRGFDPRTTEANLDRLLAILKERGIPVLLAGMRAPPNLGSGYASAFEAIFPRLAEKHDLMLYPFFLDGVAGNPALNQPDGIHPNASGVRVIVERILPSMRLLLDSAMSAQGAGSG